MDFNLWAVWQAWGILSGEYLLNEALLDLGSEWTMHVDSLRRDSN